MRLFCSACGPRYAAVRTRQKRRKAFRASRTRPSRPLAQRVSDSAVLDGSRCYRRHLKNSQRFPGQRPPQSRPCQPHPARCARISDSAPYFNSKVGARERGSLYPARTWYRAHSFGPFRPRPGRPSAFRTLPVFVGVWEPKVSQTLRRQSPPAPPRQTASPATLRFASRPMALGDLQPATASKTVLMPTTTPAPTVPPARLPAP